ncbi:hypothetical protein Tco_0616638 [Tanacetum coccineum]
MCGIRQGRTNNSRELVRTTSAVDLEEFCEKHYEKLLPIMAIKYEYEKRKKEKLEEVKAWLDFGDARKKSTRAREIQLATAYIQEQERRESNVVQAISEAEDEVNPRTPVAVQESSRHISGAEANQGIEQTKERVWKLGTENLR